MQLSPILWDLGGLPPGPEIEAAGKAGASLLQVRLRQYQDYDREEVRRICCETGLLGKPIDGIYRDRELFADLFTNAYLDYEPKWTLVVDSLTPQLRDRRPLAHKI